MSYKINIIRNRPDFIIHIFIESIEKYFIEKTHVSEDDAAVDSKTKLTSQQIF